jgi:hypothetical protein
MTHHFPSSLRDRCTSPPSQEGAQRVELKNLQGYAILNLFPEIKQILTSSKRQIYGIFSEISIRNFNVENSRIPTKSPTS